MKNSIPPEMISKKRWCCWRAVPNDKNEIQKIPWRLDGVGRLSWGDPSVLIEFEEARKAFMEGADLPEHKGKHFAGIGYILPAGDNSSRIICLDLDKCLDGETLTPGAKKIIDKFGCYIEKSPSEKGLHIWCKATLPADFKNINTREGNEPLYIDGQKVEVFVRKHFITVTNDVFQEGQPEDRTEAILELYEMRKASEKAEAPTICQPDDDKIKHYCEKALEAATREFICVPDGNRNNSLNGTAYSMGRYVGAGWLGRYQVESELLRAAKANDVPESEALATINSGIEAGMLEPKTPDLSKEIQAERKQCVTLGTNHMANIEDTLEALYTANNPPRIFQRSGNLVRIRSIGNVCKIEEITDYALRNEMSKSAAFEKFLNEKDGYVECTPSLDLARSILAMDSWEFPHVSTIVTSPIVRLDGSILLQPGYDEATLSYYAPNESLVIPELVLSEESAKEKSKWFMGEVLADFPFVDEASKANALAAFLSPIIRPMIKGCTPIALIDKPAPGTGASKLLDLISIISTGKPMAAVSPPDDEEEWRKLITGLMRDGSTLVALDNIDADLKAATLARALSSSIWKDRVLGKPDATEYPQRASWYATGNNLTLSGDIPRRAYLIQLDAKMARPWERKTFRHQDINAWVSEHRGELLAALLTMVGAWASAGFPKDGKKIIGGFDEWVSILEGILSYSGIPGYLDNLDKLYEEVDMGNDEWADFFEEWLDWHKDPMTTSQIVTDIENRHSVLGASVPSDLAEKIKYRGPGITKSVGIFLRKKLNVRYRNGLMLTQEIDTHSKKKMWKVVKVENETICG